MIQNNGSTNELNNNHTEMMIELNSINNNINNQHNQQHVSSQLNKVVSKVGDIVKNHHLIGSNTHKQFNDDHQLQLDQLNHLLIKDHKLGIY